MFSEDNMILLADKFVEQMRDDFERPFVLDDFTKFVQFTTGLTPDDWWNVALESLLVQRFDRHYDLVRHPVDIRWDFINEQIERQLTSNFIWPTLER